MAEEAQGAEQAGRAEELRADYDAAQGESSSYYELYQPCNHHHHHDSSRSKLSLSSSKRV